MTRCLGACKRPYTRDFTPEVLTHPSGVWMFVLHDTILCPDRVKWRMNSIAAAAAKLRESRST